MYNPEVSVEVKQFNCPYCGQECEFCDFDERYYCMNESCEAFEHEYFGSYRIETKEGTYFPYTLITIKPVE